MEKRIVLWGNNEYTYPGTGTFIPFLTSHIHEDQEVHPAMIVVPGGAFIQLCSGEAEGVSNAFFKMGYNTFVLVYTNNVTTRHPVYKQAMMDFARAIRILRRDWKRFGIDPDQIHGIGFSAGGTLTASMAVLWNNPSLAGKGIYQNTSAYLNSASLVYAKTRWGDDELGILLNEKRAFRLDDYVSQTSSPMFILHGTEDVMVPAVENALPMALASAKAGIPYELHLLLGCGHGFIVKELEEDGPVKSRYLFEQLYQTLQAMTEGEFEEHRDLYSPLSKNMSYNTFADIVQHIVMNKMWMCGLKGNAEDIDTAISATTGQQEKEGDIRHPSAAGWWHWVDNWIGQLHAIGK